MHTIPIKEEHKNEAQLLLWLKYNSPKSHEVRNFNDLLDVYKRATSGSHKECNCLNKGKALNQYWEKWHCTWCLKPITNRISKKHSYLNQK